jgi:hypothetical protein
MVNRQVHDKDVNVKPSKSKQRSISNKPTKNCNKLDIQASSWQGCQWKLKA